MNYPINHRNIAFILTELPLKFVKTGYKNYGIVGFINIPRTSLKYLVKPFARS